MPLSRHAVVESRSASVAGSPLGEATNSNGKTRHGIIRRRIILLENGPLLLWHTRGLARLQTTTVWGATRYDALALLEAVLQHCRYNMAYLHGQS